MGQLNSELSESPILTALARCAEDLTVGKGWPDGINALLEDLGKITGVSRVWIFQVLELSNDYILQENTFEWIKSPQYAQIGLPEFTKFRAYYNAPEYRNIVASRMRGEWQKVLVKNLSPSWLKEDLMQQEVKSMLTIPIHVEEKWWGVLGFDDCERDYDWDDSEIAAMRAAGYLISSAVLRDSMSAKRKQFSILQEITSCSSWQFDFEKNHLWCSTDMFQEAPGTSENLYYSFKDILRKVHSNDRHDFLQSILKFINGEENAYRKDIRILVQNDEYRWVEVIGNISRDATGKAQQFAGIAVDIGKRKEYEQATEIQARTDPLTGLANRRAFLEYTKHKTAEFQRVTDQQLTIVLLDIDFFKNVNDTYGHEAGDLVLVKISELINGHIRNTDVAARYGGEEFILLLCDTGNMYAAKYAERLRKKIENMTVTKDNKNIKITASFGISEFKSEDNLVHQVIARSDEALYRAKSQGRNCIVVSD